MAYPLLKLYEQAIPDFLDDYALIPEFQRLKAVGMDCGLEYTQLPFFRDFDPYSRLDHSFGVALIIHHFTHDKAQAIAGLYHDIATPCFAHVIDFLRGDYETQEATESGTHRILENSSHLHKLLKKDGMTLAQIDDYHRYPIADNDTPKLSADRLEYHLGDMLTFHLADYADIAGFYQDLCVLTNEYGETEIGFRHKDVAIAFTRKALGNVRVYLTPEDRYSMEYLARVLKDALHEGVITPEDLYQDEPTLIQKLTADKRTKAAFEGFRGLHKIVTSPTKLPGYLQIPSKKRYVDPYVLGLGRVSQLDENIRQDLRDFLSTPLTEWISHED